MKFTGRKKTAVAIPVFLTVCMLTGGCGSSLPLAYAPAVTITGSAPSLASFYAEKLCVPESDIYHEGVNMLDDSVAGLFNTTTCETLYAKNVYERINPASLTKVMTALVAIENGDLTKSIVATANVSIVESGAQKIGLKEGDRMTLDQALHIMMIYSANDVAIMVAESVGGSVDQFARMMNEKAGSIGATGCHFVNPHGLTDSDHYVTAYDMYLIFNEALKYKEFREIIDTKQYISSYRTEDGVEIPVDISSTNGFVNGNYTVPDGVKVIGGKTGTTAAAGHCLIQLVNNRKGDEIIAVVMHTPDGDTLRNEMTSLISVVND